MSWIYEQSTGKLWHDNVFIGTGYSGAGEGKNNAAMEDQHDVGPIPRGRYMVGPAFPGNYEHKGPIVMPLIPNPEDDMFGRSGFLIHGDSIGAPGTASKGCIIFIRDIRQKIAASQDRELAVTL